MRSQLFVQAMASISRTHDNGSLRQIKGHGGTNSFSTTGRMWSRRVTCHVPLWLSLKNWTRSNGPPSHRVFPLGGPRPIPRCSLCPYRQNEPSPRVRCQKTTGVVKARSGFPSLAVCSSRATYLMLKTGTVGRHSSADRRTRSGRESEAFSGLLKNVRSILSS